MHKTLKNTIHGFRQAASFARVLVYLVAAIVPVIAGECWESIPEIQDKVACSCTGIFQCTSNGNGILRYNVCNDTGGIRPGRTKKDYKPTEAGYEWVCAAAMRPGVMLCVLPCAGCPACFLAGPLSLPCFKVCAGACGTTLFASPTWRVQLQYAMLGQLKKSIFHPVCWMAIVVEVIETR